MTTAEVIAACGAETNLPFLVIGGIAVIAHGYPRDTVDLDFAVRRSDRERWRLVLNRLDYDPLHEHENFAQFVSRHGGIDVDLMFVNEPTFDSMLASAVFKNTGPGLARFPSLEVLLALKLHVAKQNIPHRTLGDLDDIINLVLVNCVNLREEKWRELFLKYGTLELYEKLVRASAP